MSTYKQYFKNKKGLNSVRHYGSAYTHRDVYVKDHDRVRDVRTPREFDYYDVQHKAGYLYRAPPL